MHKILRENTTFFSAILMRQHRITRRAAIPGRIWPEIKTCSDGQKQDEMVIQFGCMCRQQ